MTTLKRKPFSPLSPFAPRVVNMARRPRPWGLVNIILFLRKWRGR